MDYSFNASTNFIRLAYFPDFIVYTNETDINIIHVESNSLQPNLVPHFVDPKSFLIFMCKILVLEHSTKI